jgi:CBS domain-containing protein
VARRINEAHHSSAIVRRGGDLGIVTDSDFRRAAGQGRLSLDAPVGEFATFPALTIAADASRAQAFVTMVEHGVHHLVAVDDKDQPVGVVRAIDLASADVRDPLVIRAALATASSLDQLVEAAGLLPSTAVELMDSGVPAIRVGELLAAVREGLVRKLVQLNGFDEADGQCAWFVLGSTARREPLPSSDMDTAIAWASPSERSGRPPHEDTVRWRSAAARVLADMERCGLQRCPDGANATNPLFSRSVQDWGRVAAGWQRRPDGKQALLLTSMAADSHPITELSVGRAVLQQTAVSAPSRDFLAMMMRFTLAVKPPVGFVRNFVVEHSGEHRGQLNLKQGGLMPIASIGRWVAVVTGEPRGSTPERLRRGRSANILTTDETDTLIGAFELIYTLLLEQEVEALREGATASRYLHPGTLDSLTRRHLRSAFREVAHVQSSLESEWVSRLP